MNKEGTLNQSKESVACLGKDGDFTARLSHKVKKKTLLGNPGRRRRRSSGTIIFQAKRGTERYPGGTG